MSEQVLVFPEEIFIELGAFKGFSKTAAKFLKSERWLKSLHYVDRVFAEGTSRLRQVIPYLILSKPSGEILVYERSVKGGENRLHGKLSLGCGGHLNPCDGASVNAYESGLKRELVEEVGLTGWYANDILGCIYLDETPVDAVHMGFVHKITIPDGFDPVFHDAALANGAFWPIENIKHHKDLFENWSRLIISEIL